MAGSRVSFREVMASMIMARSSAEKSGNSVWIPVSTSAPKDAATKDESVCLPGRRAFAKDFRLVRSGDDTE